MKIILVVCFFIIQYQKHYSFKLIVMKNLGIASFIAASLMVGYACTSENKNNEDATEVAEDKNEEKFDTTKVEDDAEFMVAAASGGMLEVNLGEVVAKNAMSAKVKEFGAMMVADHTKANVELKALAAAKNISLPTAASDKHQEKIADITKEKGMEFDKDYIDFMINDHEEDIKLFEEEAEDGKDAEIKAFAADKIPTLKHHLQMAKEIKETLK